MSSRRGVQPLLIAAGFAVTAGCTYLAVRGVALDDARAALAASDLRWLLPASVVLAFALWLRIVRWWVLFDPSSRPPLRAVGHAAFVGYFFNNILPARAGEAARVIALYGKARTPRAETIGTVVIERVFDLLALLVLLFACYPLLPEISWLRAAALLGIVLVAGVLVLVAVLVRYDERAVRWLLSPLRRLPGAGASERVEQAVGNATRGLVALREPRVALRGMALTLASWVVLGFSFWILTAALHLDVPVVAGMLVVVAINLSLVLPSSPAALGVFEAATVVALRAFDVPRAEALSYALVLHLLNLVPFLVIGAALLGPGALRRGVRAG
ncbi:MAG TPA: lysylphosphatidylglycerol synthase transmembrane domain-containing protein [Solirubrobacteraceae bacterium]|nr:lysylphosphatidylglycerol synthase transmembrane domain-containing protein [Solirubrobacteraceae bacterium]